MTLLMAHYGGVRLLHVICVILSGGLFLSRGLLRISDAPVANHWVLRVASYLIDTALLAAGILLTLMLHQYPLTDAWLTTKVLLLVVYIGLGRYALKRADRGSARIVAYIGALVTYAFIIGVAVTHHPAGWFTLFGG
jgi:uncharacterized membrane protein SirB2